MSRTAVFSLTIFLLVFAAVESASYLIAIYVFPTSVIFRPAYSEPEESALKARYREYLEYRNPILGWPFRHRAKVGRDVTGARFNQHFPYTEKVENCVSIYGDSFTWSSEVNQFFAWSTVLSKFLNCRVANYGVGGYGSDQAYLRYLNNPNDHAPIVFLNHLSENILRNSSQFTALVGGYSPYDIPLSFKPRFVLDENAALKLIDLPTFDAGKFPDVLTNPEEYLRHEFFLPGGDTGLVRLKFPYSWTLARATRHFHVKAKLADEPWFMEFYDPEHPANGLDVTAKILLAFRESALKRGQIPVITIIPTGLDLMYYSEYAIWPYQNLLDQLTEAGVNVLNFGEGVMERLGEDDPCSLFKNCSAHFNKQGYRYIAEIAFAELETRGLTADSSAP